MSRIRTVLAAAFIAVCFSVPGAARAANCQLVQLAAFDMAPKELTQIPVAIGGKLYHFTLDMDAPFSSISRDVAKAEGFAQSPVPAHVIMTVGARSIYHLATVPQMHIGSIAAEKVSMAEMPPQLEKVYGDGIIGLDLLAGVDVEMDPAHGKIRLFSQDHCPGGVVYWSRNYAVMPLHKSRAGYRYFQVDLDGKKVRAHFKPEQENVTMTRVGVCLAFGIHRNDPKLVPVGPHNPKAQILRYPFRKMMVGNLEVDYPEIDLLPVMTANGAMVWPGQHNLVPIPSKCDDIRRLRSDHKREWKNVRGMYGPIGLWLGMQELRRFHLYFAFKENKLYVTPADASLTSVASAPSQR